MASSINVKIAPLPRGAYSSSATYAKLDVVSYNGSSYMAIKAVPTGTVPTNTTYWQVLVEQPSLAGLVTSEEFEDLAHFVGYNETDEYGVEVDMENNQITRIGAGAGKDYGQDFDSLFEWRRCNLSDSGVVNAYYGDSGYKDDGSNGQVMVEIPALYYRVVPMKTVANSYGGYANYKCRYYVSKTPEFGFKLHPAYYDADGNMLDKIYVSAYEGSLWDASASAYVADTSGYSDTAVPKDYNADKLSSVAGVMPITNITKPNFEKIAQNRGARWHNFSIQVASLIQLCFLVEYATFNWQTYYTGVTAITDDSSKCCASYCGSTASLGNASGNATATKDYLGTEQAANGKKSFSYRGVENFFGNVWKHISNIVIYGTGEANGGRAYVRDDYVVAESSVVGMKATDICLPNVSTVATYFGIAEDAEHDYALLISVSGTNKSKLNDYVYVTPNLSGYRIALLGGFWNYGSVAGGFFWGCADGAGRRGRAFGARAVYL